VLLNWLKAPHLQELLEQTDFRFTWGPKVGAEDADNIQHAVYASKTQMRLVSKSFLIRVQASETAILYQRKVVWKPWSLMLLHSFINYSFRHVFSWDAAVPAATLLATLRRLSFHCRGLWRSLCKISGQLQSSIGRWNCYHDCASEVGLSAPVTKN